MTSYYYNCPLDTEEFSRHGADTQRATMLLLSGECYSPPSMTGVINRSFPNNLPCSPDRSHHKESLNHRQNLSVCMQFKLLMKLFTLE